MPIARWLLVLCLLGGCTMTKGSGKGGDIRLKVNKVEHALTLPPTSFRGDGYELVVERIFLVEELSGKFTVVGQSGKVYSAHPNTRGSRGKTGWLQEHTKGPTHLPPDARGLIEVFAGSKVR
jgi:hypothetical protein